jgi:hypothetical protein
MSRRILEPLVEALGLDLLNVHYAVTQPQPGQDAARLRQAGSARHRCARCITMLLWESSRYPPGQTITRSASRCALARGEHHREGIGTKEGRAHLQEPQHQARGVLQPTTNALAIGPTQGGVPAHRGEHRWLRGRPAADAVYRASGIELLQRIEQGLEQDPVPAVEDSEKVRCRNCQTLSPSDAAGSTAVPPYWELPSITALGFTGKAARFGNGASGPAERVVSAPGIEPRTY